IVWTADADGARRLLVASPEELSGGAAPVTPADLQVREIMGTDGETVLFTASAGEPAEVGLWIYGPGGLESVTTEPRGHHGPRAGGTTVIASRTLAADGVSVRVTSDGSAGLPITSLAELP